MTEAGETKIAVLFLARKAEGLEALETFVASYQRHPAGASHDLVVIFKGFDGEADAKEAQALFSQSPHLPFFVDDTGFDLGSYHRVAARLPHDYICCFNTYSEICADEWLQSLFQQISSPGVGMAGATASYESIRSSIQLIDKLQWMMKLRYMPARFRDLALKYYNPPPPKRGAAAAGHAVKPKRSPLEKCWRNIHRIYLQITEGTLLRKLRLWIAAHQKEKGYIYILNSYEEYYTSRLSKSETLRLLHQFPPFPNPHLRSNAFIIRRQDYLSALHSNLTTKFEAFAVESGENSLTRQCLKKSLRVRLVDKYGNGFDVEDWPTSKTFRQGRQENLMVRDNITRAYDALDEGSRLTFRMISWGEDYVERPPDYPETTIRFANKLSKA